MKFTRCFVLFVVIVSIIDVALSKKSYIKKRPTNTHSGLSKPKSTKLNSIPEKLREDRSKASSSLETIKEEDKLQIDDIENWELPSLESIFEEEEDDDNETEGSVADNEDDSDIESDSEDDDDYNEIDDKRDEHVSNFHKYYENYYNLKNKKESSSTNKSKNLHVPSYKAKKHY